MPNGSSKFTSAALAVSIVLAVIVVALGIAILVMSFQSKDFAFQWSPGGGPRCTSNEECNRRLCGGASGCCATCSAGSGRCEKGSLTANGCETAPAQFSESKVKPQPQQEMSFSAGCTSSANTAPSHSPATSCATGSATGSAAGSLGAFQTHPGTPKMTDAYCLAKLAGPNPTSTGEQGSFCAVAQNNTCVPGVVTASGACQTQVQQAAWANWGPHMPNTYLISTSGTNVGVTMGGCDVRPIGSSTQNYVGLFNSCQPKAPVPNFGREYASDFAAPNHSSCG